MPVCPAGAWHVPPPRPIPCAQPVARIVAAALDRAGPSFASAWRKEIADGPTRPALGPLSAQEHEFHYNPRRSVPDVEPSQRRREPLNETERRGPPTATSRARCSASSAAAETARLGTPVPPMTASAQPRN